MNLLLERIFCRSTTAHTLVTVCPIEWVLDSMRLHLCCFFGPDMHLVDIDYSLGELALYVLQQLLFGSKLDQLFPEILSISDSMCAASPFETSFSLTAEATAIPAISRASSRLSRSTSAPRNFARYLG
jgi:hypothetical protein